MDVLPIDLTAVIAVTGGILMLLIPIAGITARFALKPIAEAIARVREAEGANREMAFMQQRLDLIEGQLSSLESSVQRLTEVQEFHAELRAPEE